jgi:SagB-type dehydrogenase family enzyme
VNAYIFTGPTLSASEGREELSATYLPPAAQGDVYRVAMTHPKAIGIIDGYFERLPAIWHKEILWAMQEGIHVFGCSSMGALRAAELAPFGMEGVGVVFEAFRDGALEADDEVAVAHGLADSGYATFSEAMVNIRQTLAHAVDCGVISRETGNGIERIAKDTYYPRRIYPLFLELAKEQGLPDSEIEAFRAWLPSGRVNQKRLDALQMLRVIRERLESSQPPKPVRYAFEHTNFWERAKFSAGQLQADSGCEAEMISLDMMQEELALDPAAQARAKQGTLLRLFALETARRAGTPVGQELLLETVEKFRRERDLLESEEVEGWLAAQRLDREGFSRLIEAEARVRWAIAWAEPELHRLLPDYLRVTGEYSRLLARTSHKQEVLKSKGLRDLDSTAAGLTQGELEQWYFEQCLGRPTPTDLRAFARSSGFADEISFRRAIFREFCYRHPQRVLGAVSASGERKEHGTSSDDLTIPLPDRFPDTSFRFEDVMMRRRSFRSFSTAPIELETFAKLLSLCDGPARGESNEDGTRRTAPSAGSLYPIDIYCLACRVVGLDAGVYHFHPPSHTLQRQAKGDCIATLRSILPEYEFLDRACACVVLVISLARLESKYGERSYRFALLEAGHIAQNLLLAATAEGVAALPVGGFIEDKLNTVLGLNGRDEFAIYLILLGCPPENERKIFGCETSANSSIRNIA